MKTTRALPLLGATILAIAAPARAQQQPTPYPPYQAYQTPPRVEHSLYQPQGPVYTSAPLPFAVTAELRTTWPQDSGGRRVLGKSSATGGGVAIHYDAWRPMARLVAKADLGGIWTSTSDGQSGTSNLETLNTTLISLGISARYELFRWLAPYARVAGGYGRDKLTVGNSSGQLHDEQSFAHGSLGGGLWLRSPGLALGSSGLALALTGSIEAGYMLASSSNIALQSAPASGSGSTSTANPVPTQPVAIGQVGRDAPYLQVTIGLAF